MAYKIAVASSDGVNIDLSFGAAEGFLIYEVSGPGAYELVEKRMWLGTVNEIGNADCANANSCGSGTGCGGGTGSAKAAILSDVRCLVCSKVGFKVQKQLERQAVTVFDIACPIDEALERITVYFDKVDRHQSLRRIAREQINGGI